MTIKTYLFLLIFAIFFAACTDNNDLQPTLPDEEEIIDEPNEESPEPVMPVIMKMESNTANIFEMLMIDIVENPDTAPKIGGLDSIVWTYEGEEGTVDVMKRGEGSSIQMVQWGQYLYEPGTFMSYLHGYRDGKIVGTDSAEIVITDNHDFLNLDWHAKYDPTLGNGYWNSDLRDYYFVFNHGGNAGKGTNTYANLYARFEGRLSREKEEAKSKEVLIDYITRLFGEPAHEGEPEELKDIFLENFKIHPEEREPIKIWFTDKTKMAMMRHKTSSNVYEYNILAEPAIEDN